MNYRASIVITRSFSDGVLLIVSILCIKDKEIHCLLLIYNKFLDGHICNSTQRCLLIFYSLFAHINSTTLFAYECMLYLLLITHYSTALGFIFEQQNSFVPLIAAFIAHIAELKVSASSRSFE